MSTFLKPSNWFRNSRRRSGSQQHDDQQSGLEHVDKHTVVNCHNEQEDGFTCVEVRPMTYAEASCTIYPAANARIVTSQNYSSIDESRLAVQMVEQFEAKAQAAAKSPVSRHVIASAEYGVDSVHNSRSRKRSSKNKRRRQ